MRASAGAVLSALLLACRPGGSASLELRIVDAATGGEAPARVELLDERGEAQIPSQALPLRFECVLPPLPDFAAELLTLSNAIENRASGTTQFYSDGSLAVELPPGRYRLRAFKGIEYRVAERSFELSAGETLALEVELRRWIDMPARGWWSADDHIHISRLTADDDRGIATWMRAEDLHVANLLQMGTLDQFGVTPQHDFGAEGEYRLGDTLLLAGQEHPRTHFLGHTIVLGADAPVDLRETYIDYEPTWRAALRARGLPGYAHQALGPGRDGLALDAPRGLVSFVEVLQFDVPFYDVWYEFLDLGIRLAPTAGTDFPCGPAWNVPGRERFYARFEGPPGRERWLESVRRGRTFVTNGPLLELRAGGAQIGDELRLAAPGPVVFEGSVRFDPARDDVRGAELVESGDPIPLVLEWRAPGDAAFRIEREVRPPAWYALRVLGSKRGETPVAPGQSRWMLALFERVTNFREHVERGEAFHSSRERVRPAAAHTSAIWVSVAGGPALDGARARTRATAALARLDALEARLSDAALEAQTFWDLGPYSDVVPVEHLLRNRPALLRAIAEARARYRALLEPGAPAAPPAGGTP